VKEEEFICTFTLFEHKHFNRHTRLHMMCTFLVGTRTCVHTTDTDTDT
jgi:hypothetical protein